MKVIKWVQVMHAVNSNMMVNSDLQFTFWHPLHLNTKTLQVSFALLQEIEWFCAKKVYIAIYGFS